MISAGPPLSRVAIIGNASGGKSTLARSLASRRDLPLTELDRLLWRPGWTSTAPEIYARQHEEAIGRGTWVIEGPGALDSIPPRITRATEIILIDLPLWVHFWLAAERQVAGTQGTLAAAPAGAVSPPPTRALFETMWRVETDWMPTIRILCDAAEREGKAVVRLRSLEELDAFAGQV